MSNLYKKSYECTDREWAKFMDELVKQKEEDIDFILNYGDSKRIVSDEPHPEKMINTFVLDDGSRVVSDHSAGEPCSQKRYRTDLAVLIRNGVTRNEFHRYIDSKCESSDEFPCDCGGSITLDEDEEGVWSCDTCGFVATDLS